MANVLYPLGRKAFLDGDIDYLVDTIKVALINTSVYTYSAAHDFYNDVSGVIGTPQTLGTKTSTGGVADAADTVFTAVTAGSTVGALIIYKDTGSSATSALIAYFDTATNLPIATNGGDITIAWNASGIFAL